jgi:hypothetical protein
MTIFHQAIAIFIIPLLMGCGGHSDDTSTLDKAPVLVDTPKNRVKNYGASDSNRLFVFVGEKIFVEQLPNDRASMDAGFRAKYAILQRLYGEFPEDTIEFVTYDHYGTPAFSMFKHVLLYVSADSGDYYHQKYLYNDVYKTKDGRWASPYEGGDYEHAYNRYTRIKPVKIPFAQKISYPTKILDEEGRQHELSYPTPYYKTIGDSAIVVYGNYIEDLFALKKSGVLTGRGLFEATPQQEEDMVESMQPKPPTTAPSADDLTFLRFWKHFVATLGAPGLESFSKVALDTLYVCGKLVPASTFIDKCFKEVVDDEVRKRIMDRTKLEYSSTPIEFYHLLTAQVKREIMAVGDSYQLRKMTVTRNTKNNNPPAIYFNFIESKNGYRLYEIGHHWFKECCQ